MKKRLRTTISAGLLAVAMLTGASAVNATVMPQSSEVTLTPYNASGEQLIPDDKGQYADPAYFTLTYTNPAIKAGEQYIVLIVSGQMGADGTLPDITASTIQYINQTASLDGSVTFDNENIYPKSMTDSVLLIAGKDLENSPRLLAIVKLNQKKGDLSGEGKIDTVDATMMLQHIAKIKMLTDSQISIADINGDSKVDTVDATILLQFIAKLISELK